MISHHIQRDIVHRLSREVQLRFSELKPEGMENNAFMYHLRQLLREKYVEKVHDAYRLTGTGKTYITSLSSTDGKPRQQPKLVSIIVLTDTQQQVMLAQRKEEPSVNTWMLPSGKQHFGETSDEQARREVLEQFGIDEAPARRGYADIQIRYDNELVTHLSATIFALNTEVETPSETQKFVYAWHPVDKLASLALTPGTLELLRHVQTDDELFYASLKMKA